jgi:hypothetical protein
MVEESDKDVEEQPVRQQENREISQLAANQRNNFKMEGIINQVKG